MPMQTATAVESQAEAAIRLQVDAITDEEGFDRLREEWDELLEHSAQHRFFLRWSWNRLWWKTYAPRGSRLWLITCRDARGRLIGLAPFYLKGVGRAQVHRLREVCFLGTGIFVKTSEYLDLIARRDYEPQVITCLTDYLQRSRDWDRLLWEDAPDSSSLLEQFRMALSGDWHIQARQRSYHVNTIANWGDIEQGLHKKFRKNLSRMTKRVVNTGGVQLHCVRDETELDAALQALIRLHQARWAMKGEPGSFALYGMKLFIGEVARASLQEGRLRLWTLELKGKTVAAELAFVDNGIAHYFQGGFDPDYAKESIGAVMDGLCIRDCITDPMITEFDFMGGGDAYKSLWTADGRETTTWVCARKGWRTQVFHLLTGGKQLLKTTARRLISERLRRALHKKLLARRYYTTP